MNLWIKQLGLLIKTQFVLRRRRPFRSAAELLWPAIVVSVLLFLRLATDPGNGKPCHSGPIAMPSAGLLPFVHSVLCPQKCATDNSSLDSKSEVQNILTRIEPLVNDRRSRLLRSLPQTVQLLQTANEAAKDPAFQQIFEQTYTVSDLFIKPEEVQKYLENGVLSPAASSAFLSARLNLPRLLNMKQMLDVHSIECNASALSQLVDINHNHLSFEQLSGEICASGLFSNKQHRQTLLGNFDYHRLIRILSTFPSLLGDQKMQDSLLDVSEMLGVWQRVRGHPEIKQLETLLHRMSGSLPALWRLAAFSKSSEHNMRLLAQVTADWQRIAGSDGQWKTLSEGVRMGQQILNWYSYGRQSQGQTRRAKRQDSNNWAATVAQTVSGLRNFQFNPGNDFKQFEPAIVGLTYFSERLNVKLQNAAAQSLTLEQMLQNRAELLKFVYWFDKYGLAFVEMYAYAWYENNQKYPVGVFPTFTQDMQDFYTRICAPNAYQMLQSSMVPASEVQAAVDRFCSININKAFLEAVDWLEDNQVPGETPEQKLQRLSYIFRSGQKADLQQLSNNLGRVARSARTLVAQNPQFAKNELTFNFLDDHEYTVMLEKYMNYLMSHQNWKASVKQVISSLCDQQQQYGGRGGEAQSMIKTIFDYGDLLVDNVKTGIALATGSLEQVPQIERYSEFLKLVPLYKKGFDLVQIYMLSNQQKINQFQQYVSGSDGFQKFCTMTNLTDYFTVPEGTDVADIQRQICNIDWQLYGYQNQMVYNVSGWQQVLNSQNYNYPIRDGCSALKSQVDYLSGVVQSIGQMVSTPNVTIYGATPTDWNTLIGTHIEKQIFFGYEDLLSKDKLVEALKSIPMMASPGLANNMDAQASVQLVNKKLDMLSSDQPYALNDMFPNSPSTVQAVRSLLPISPKLLKLYLWMSYTNSYSALQSRLNSVRTAQEAEDILCSAGTNLTSYLYVPGFTETDWRQIQGSFCYILQYSDQISRELNQQVVQEKTQIAQNNPTQSGQQSNMVSEVSKLIDNVDKLSAGQFNLPSDVPGDWQNPQTWAAVVQQTNQEYMTYSNSTLGETAMTANHIESYLQGTYSNQVSYVRYVAGKVLSAVVDRMKVLSESGKTEFRVEDLVPGRYTTLQQMLVQGMRVSPAIAEAYLNPPPQNAPYQPLDCANVPAIFLTPSVWNSNDQQIQQFIKNTDWKRVNEEMQQFMGIDMDQISIGIRMNAPPPEVFSWDTVAQLGEQVSKRAQQMQAQSQQFAIPAETAQGWQALSQKYPPNELGSNKALQENIQALFTVLSQCDGQMFEGYDSVQQSFPSSMTLDDLGAMAPQLQRYKAIYVPLASVLPPNYSLREFLTRTYKNVPLFVSAFQDAQVNLVSLLPSNQQQAFNNFCPMGVYQTLFVFSTQIDKEWFMQSFCGVDYQPVFAEIKKQIQYDLVVQKLRVLVGPKTRRYRPARMSKKNSTYSWREQGVFIQKALESKADLRPLHDFARNTEDYASRLRVQLTDSSVATLQDSLAQPASFKDWAVNKIGLSNDTVELLMKTQIRTKALLDPWKICAEYFESQGTNWLTNSTDQEKEILNMALCQAPYYPYVLQYWSVGVNRGKILHEPIQRDALDGTDVNWDNVIEDLNFLEDNMDDATRIWPDIQERIQLPEELLVPDDILDLMTETKPRTTVNYPWSSVTGAWYLQSSETPRRTSSSSQATSTASAAPETIGFSLHTFASTVQPQVQTDSLLLDLFNWFLINTPKQGNKQIDWETMGEQAQTVANQLLSGLNLTDSKLKPVLVLPRRGARSTGNNPQDQKAKMVMACTNFVTSLSTPDTLHNQIALTNLTTVQLEKYPVYKDIICNMSNMDIGSLHQMLMQDLGWLHTIEQWYSIRQESNLIKACEAFVDSGGDMVHSMKKVLHELKGPSGTELRHCLVKADSESFGTLSLYLQLIQDLAMLAESGNDISENSVDEYIAKFSTNSSFQLIGRSGAEFLDSLNQFQQEWPETLAMQMNAIFNRHDLDLLLESGSNFLTEILKSSGKLSDLGLVTKGINGAKTVKKVLQDALNSGIEIRELDTTELSQHLFDTYGITTEFFEDLEVIPSRLLSALQLHESLYCIHNLTSQWIFTGDENLKLRASSMLCSAGGGNYREFVELLLTKYGFQQIIASYMQYGLQQQLQESGVKSEDALYASKHMHELPEFLAEASSQMQLFTELTVPAALLRAEPLRMNRNAAAEPATSADALRDAFCGTSHQTIHSNFDVGSNSLSSCEDFLNQADSVQHHFLTKFLHGEIALVPDDLISRTIIRAANKTFTQLAGWSDFVHLAADAENLTKNIQTAQMMQLKAMFSSPIMHDFLRNTIRLDSYQLMEVLESSKHLNPDAATRISKLMKKVTLLLDCISTDRFRFYADENELEQRIGNGKPLLAAVIFHHQKRYRRNVPEQSFDNGLPTKLNYTIRMEAVPSTTEFNRQIHQLNFLNGLPEYLLGFAQLQDMIDTGFIELWSSHRKNDVFTFVQQIPMATEFYDWYPEYLKHWLPMTMLVCWILLLGFHAHSFLYEKETGLNQVLKVTGLKPGVQETAWFTSSYLIWLITMLSVAVILKLGNILPNAQFSVLLVLFIGFATSMLALINLVCTFCTRANFGTFLASTAYLFGYLPFLVVSMDSHQTVYPNWVKVLTCFSAPSSLAWACHSLAAWDTVGGIQWSSLNSDCPALPEHQITFATALGFLFIDTAIYTILALVFPKLFRLMKHVRNLNRRPVRNLPKSVESSSSVFQANFNELIGLSAKHLSKHYPRSRKAAVHDLNLDLYQAQVTCLLGTNGAGKTTTVNLLTGIAKPDSGMISVMGAELDSYHGVIGLCPQHNALFSHLTVKEHMQLYAGIGSYLSATHQQADIKNLLFQIGLHPKANELVCHLSGGMRRRLCVALAFIGGSRLVVLDEPTAGIDPVARRAVWHLIGKQKKNRTILLCTHYLDEAELLADRIAVLSRGRLLCSGSQHDLQPDKGFRLTVRRHDPVTCPTDRVLRIAYEMVSDVRLVKQSQCQIVLAVNGSDEAMKEIVANLEKERDENCLKIHGFAVSYVTLEETFLEITKDHRKQEDSSENDFSDFKSSNIQASHYSDIDLMKLSKSRYSSDSISFKFQQFYAILLQRFNHCRRDSKLMLGVIGLPCLFVFLAVAFSMLRPTVGAPQSLLLSPQIYKPTEPFYSDATDKKLLETTLNFTDCGLACMENLSAESKHLMDYLAKTYSQMKDTRTGGFSLKPGQDGYVSTIWHDLNALHAVPAYLCKAKQSELPAGLTIDTYSKPIRFRNEDLLMVKFADTGISFVFLCAFASIPAALAVFVVNERLRKERCLQRLSGVGPCLYWCSSLLWDMFCYSVAVTIACIIVCIFGNSVFAGNNIFATFSLAILFGMGMFPLIYLIQELFTDATSVYVVVFSSSVLLGAGSVICSTFFDIFFWVQRWQTARKIIESLFLLLPQYCLTGGLVEMARDQLKAHAILGISGLESSYNPFSSIGTHCLTLFLVGVCFLTSRILLDYFKERGKRSWNPPSNERVLDRDLAAEKCRIHASADVLRLFNLRKSYRTGLSTHPAVDDVSFGVQSAECFGLLGLNGAGKTSIFEIITGNQRTTDGALFLHDQSLPSCRPGQLSYCPQQNACDPMLTGREWLVHMALLHGYKSSAASSLARSWLSKMELSAWADMPTYAYSGGNRRKLCLAAALIGDSQLVLLDEPTAGMCPSGRRQVWAQIRSVVAQGRSVLFTSHCMPECEAVCDRMAFMVNGHLKAIGTTQHLKHKFSSALVLCLHCASSQMCDKVIAGLKSCLGQNLARCQKDGSCAQVRVKAMELSLLMESLIELKQIDNAMVYSVGQGSLEEAFLRFASEQSDALLAK